MEAASKLMDELREVVATAEELLASAGSENAERLKAIRDRAEAALSGMRGRVGDVKGEVEDRVREHPYAALGIAAAVGLVAGLLLSRK